MCSLRVLYAEFAAQVGGHQFFDGFFRVTAAEEVVQFGDSGFGGHVAADDGAGLRADGGGVFDSDGARTKVRITKSEISMRTWRAPMSAAS